MSFFRGLFGRKPKQTDPDTLLRLLSEFVNAPTWSDSGRIVAQHPELLGEEAGGLLCQQIAVAQAQGDGTAVRVLQEHRVLQEVLVKVAARLAISIRCRARHDHQHWQVFQGSSGGCVRARGTTHYAHRRRQAA